MAFHGSYGAQGCNKRGMERTNKTNGNKGIMRQIRTLKRQEAERRNKMTPDHRTRSYRLEMYRAGELAPYPGSRDARQMKSRKF